MSWASVLLISNMRFSDSEEKVLVIMGVWPRRLLVIDDHSPQVVTITVTFQRVYEISADSPTHATWVRLASVRYVPFEERPDVHLRELAREGIDDLAVTIERDRWKALHTELFGQLGMCLHV
jgi:hypothetical protein